MSGKKPETSAENTAETDSADENGTKWKCVRRKGLSLRRWFKCSPDAVAQKNVLITGNVQGTMLGTELGIGPNCGNDRI